MLEKFFLQSKTIIGAIVTILPVIAGLAGFSFTGEDGALITEAWDTILQAIGTVLVVYGRFTANTTLKIAP